MVFGIMNYVRECRRVLYVASRPKRRDFDQIVKITGLGILLIGAMGVLLSFLLNLI